MQIVIDIDEKTIDAIKHEDFFINLGRSNGKTILCNIINAIETATPLPKGHGDLIDRNEVIKSLFDYHNGKKTIGQCIDDVQTIIDADKENGANV